MGCAGNSFRLFFKPQISPEFGADESFSNEGQRKCDLGDFTSKESVRKKVDIVLSAFVDIQRLNELIVESHCQDVLLMAKYIHIVTDMTECIFSTFTL